MVWKAFIRCKGFITVLGIMRCKLGPEKFMLVLKL